MEELGGALEEVYGRAAGMQTHGKDAVGVAVGIGVGLVEVQALSSTISIWISWNETAGIAEVGVNSWYVLCSRISYPTLW